MKVSTVEELVQHLTDVAARTLHVGRDRISVHVMKHPNDRTGKLVATSIFIDDEPLPQELGDLVRRRALREMTPPS